MKLYTEEQVKKAIAMGYDWCHQKHIPSDDVIDTFIENLTSIELPSDEEIKKEMEYDEFDPYDVAYFGGLTYMRDLIQGGNDDKQ